MDSLERKINDVDVLTQSQTDRLNLATQVQENLIRFVNAQIDKISSKDSLLSLALQAAGDKLQQDIEDGTLSWPALLKVIEISSKNQNDITLGLFDIIKGSQKTIVEKQTSDQPKQPQEKVPEISNENYAKIKQFVDLFQKVRTSEFSQKEDK